MNYARKVSWFYVVPLIIIACAALYASSSLHHAHAQIITPYPTRRQVMWNAEHYRLHTWIPSADNVGTRSGWAWSSCRGQNVWTTITSAFYAGQWVQGVAYQWGGWDTLTQFQTNLNNGLLAGDTDESNFVSCPGGGTEKPVFYNATGVDCSGFVTRAWGRDDQKYSTSTLPNISTPIEFDQGDHRNDLPRRMRMGDTFDWIGNHVVLLHYFDPADGNRPYLYESNWDANQVIHSSGWALLEASPGVWGSYGPYRYNDIVDDVYLPDIRANDNGWTSTIVVKNDSLENAVVQVTFYDAGGNAVATATETQLPERGVWELAASDILGSEIITGTAVVAADKDVYVLAENLKSGEATNYNGITPSNGLGNPGWGQTGTTIFAPSVKYKLNGRTGQLYILNAGASTATITPAFRPKDNGTPTTTCSSFTLSPLELRVYDAGDCGLSATGRLYGVKLTSDQSLAVVVVEQGDSGAALAATANAFSTHTQDNVNTAPLIKSNFPDNNPNSSATVVQNASPLGSGATLVNIYYYQRDTGDYLGTDDYNLWFLSSHIFPASTVITSNQVASAWISGGDKLVSSVYEYKVSGDWRMQYSGFLAGSTTVVLPRIYKQRLEGSLTWNTGIQVQNVQPGEPATVTIYYYGQNGGSPVATETKTVPSLTSVTFNPLNNPNVPNDFVGSAVVTSNQPIVAVVNVTNNGGGDAAMSYNGFNR